MYKDTKTVGALSKKVSDPLSSLKRESTDRMKAALLSASLDDPLSTAAALKQVTILRVSHQVTRIVQYLELMDKLEDKLYESIEYVIDYDDSSDFGTLTKLLAIQERVQKAIIESNKLLAPYLEMDQYQAFNEIEAPTPVSAEVLDLPSSERNALRENAESILADLAKLQSADTVVSE